MGKQIISGVPAEHEHAHVIERPDGFYWLDDETNKECGPFPTAVAAMEDMEYNADSDYEPAESLLEAEGEIGISDWIDPDTGLPAEESFTHLND